MDIQTKKFGVNNEIEYVLCSEKDFESCKKALNVYFSEEPVSNGLKINCSPSDQAIADVMKLCQDIVKDGVSIIAKDVLSGEVVGVSINKIHYPPVSNEPTYFQHFTNERCSSEKSKALMKYIIDVHSKFNPFKYYNINCLIEMVFVAALPTHRGRSICMRLAECLIELINEMKLGKHLSILPSQLKMNRPAAILAIVTSKYSQAVGYKLNFDILCEDDYKNYTFKGKSFAEYVCVADQPKWQLIAKKMTIDQSKL